MKAVILAGGLGTRLRPFTEVIPKPLLPIGEKSVLEIQIEHLKKFGFDEIYVATNYKSEYIETFLGDGSRYGVKLKISKEEKALGTAGPISLLKNELTEPFIMINGDILSNVDYKALNSFGKNLGTPLVVGIKEIVTPFRFGNISYTGDFVTHIEEKPNIKTTILSGIYYFNPDIFKFIPENKYFGMDVLIQDMINAKIHVGKYLIKEYWLDIGQVDDYNEAQKLYNEHLKDKL